MGLKSKYAPETFLSNPQRLRKYAIWSSVATLVVSLAAAACGWAMIATGNRYFMRSEPGYFYVQALMFTFMFLANAPGPFILRTTNRAHIQYCFFAAFALALVSLPVGCYALGKAFNHKTKDNFLDACIGWDFDEGGAADCRRSEKALRAYVAASYVLSWIVQGVAGTFTWYHYRHLSNAFAEAAEEEEKAMLRPMSYASTRGSRMSYASAGGDRRMSSYGGNDPRMAGHQRASSDPRMSMSGDRRASNRTSRHAPSPQNTYRQSILRNSVVVGEHGQQLMADGRQRGSILMNRDDVFMGQGDVEMGRDEPFVPNPYSRHSYGHARGDSYGPTNREAYVHAGDGSYSRENRMSLLAEDNQLIARDDSTPGVAFPTPDVRPTPPGLTPPGSEEYFDPYSPAPAHSSNSDSSYTGNASSGYPANNSNSGLGHSNSNSGLGHSEGTNYGTNQSSSDGSRATSASEHATMKPAPSRQVSYSEGPAPGQAPSRRVSFEEEAALREQLLAAQGREAQRQATAAGGPGAAAGGIGAAAGGLGAASGQSGSRESVTMPGGFSTPQQSFSSPQQSFPSPQQSFSSPDATAPDGAAPTRKRVISFDLSGSAPPTPGRVSRKSSFARLRGMLSGSKDETQPLASAKH
ncbi:hypothetical protein EV122DRAFT_281125 [Schizophyllum commune]